MLPTSFLSAVLALVAVASAVPQVEIRGLRTQKRYAYVCIRNNSPQRLRNVTLFHKYSDVYKHKQDWPIAEKRGCSSPQMKVEYDTGLFTLGRDWWMLAFTADDSRTIYLTTPKNARGLFDWLDRIFPTFAIITSGTVVSLATMAHPVLSFVSGSATSIAMRIITDQIFNAETTAGYKQHILRESDAMKLMEIVINADYTVTFKSKSGISRTITTSAPSVPDEAPPEN
ncbi:hypothetical protein DCS_02915 [Drechmeria coniospora]|uniref:Up-regulated in Daf-2 domain-containing protein n=1 Tax=Drechmeria coniospora TaxID=98403 RepID=A0A151GXH4_DRECN|nr:hypothetical protein DCS_02915 [Drechmeria coniospora]KYK61771.1 hypothetical protein DCS_02915 [Drechmeria coniospora]